MLDKFSEYLYELSLSENTVKSYCGDIKLFLNYFEEHFGEDLQRLNHMYIVEYKQYLLDTLHASVFTINRKLSAIARYNDFLIENNIQEDNVVKQKDYIKVQQSLIAPEVPDDRSMNKLKNSALESKRDFCAITILASAGLRVSELVNLQITDLEFDRRDIKVIGKGNKLRLVVMNDKVYYAIKDYLKEREENGLLDISPYLFIGKKTNRKDPKPLNRNAINRILEKYCSSSNIDKIHPHLLRDLFCTNAYHKGELNEMQLANQAGHNNINTTRKYVHISREDMRNNINRV